jgi:hypothetical protein
MKQVTGVVILEKHTLPLNEINSSLFQVNDFIADISGCRSS